MGPAAGGGVATSAGRCGAFDHAYSKNEAKTLYLVSRLADIYGGAVSLDESTEGATFRVTLKSAE